MAGLGQGRELGTVLFVDVVDSTRVLAQVGDERWAALLDALEGAIGEAVAARGGQVVKTTGDGALALLPGPTAAVDCAAALHEAAGALGLLLRAGAHTGELQRRGNDISGLAVHVAARLMGLAEGGETFVSAMVTLLAADTGFTFEGRGRQTLKGLSAPVEVFASSPPSAGPPGSRPQILGQGADEGVEALLASHGAAGFLDVDVAFVRRIERALDQAPADELVVRAQLEAKLAYELRGDPATLERRERLLTDAASHAEASGDRAALLAALLARQHALWDPAGAEARLVAAEEATSIARDVGDIDGELGARLARVHALIEVGRLADAEVELATYARLAAPLDRPDLRVFVSSRRSLVAAIRGRFDEAARHADEAADAAAAAGMQDADRLVAALHGPVDRARGNLQRFEAGEGFLNRLATTLPGHHFEATLAALLLDVGRPEAARVELARAMPSLSASTGHRWLAAACEAARVAAAVGTVEDCRRLHDLLVPNADRFATLGPAFFGAVRQYLGPLAVRLGSVDDAVAHLERAVADLDAMAALPHAAVARGSLAEAYAARGDHRRAEAVAAAALEMATPLGMAPLVAALSAASRESTTAWSLRRDGDDWVLAAGDERGRFRDARGFGHLHTLVANPHRDIPAADLEAGVASAGPVGGDRPATLDQAAIAAYRARLDRIKVELDAADRAGDATRAGELEVERTSLVSELKRGIGLGGRSRLAPDAGERALG